MHKQNKPYGIVLVGCGHIGMEHLLDIYYRPGIQVIGVVDTNEEKAKQAAHRCGALSYSTDYHEYLTDCRVDIVIIATYTNTHLPILKECIAHHKHVLCEKPIATTVEEGAEFYKVAKQAKEKVLVAHVLRHNRSYQMIKQLVEDGEIGDLRLMRMIQNHHAMDWPRYCRLMKDCSPTMDCGVHYYDIAQWIGNSPITQVTGFGALTQDDAPQENYTLVTFTMENGCVGFYEAGWGENFRSANVKEFIGTKGRITLEMAANRAMDREEGDLITLYQNEGKVYRTINVQSVYKDMFAQLQTLIDMIENDTQGNPSLDEMYRAFLVSLTADDAVMLKTTMTVGRFPDHGENITL